MKISISFFVLAIVGLVAGCHTEDRTATDTSSVTRRTTTTTAAAPAPAQAPASAQAKSSAAPHVSYRVEVIPNTRLSATSREGDKPNEVYSSNIIAVYVTTNGVDAQTTNLNTAGTLGNSPTPASTGSSR